MVRPTLPLPGYSNNLSLLCRLIPVRQQAIHEDQIDDVHFDTRQYNHIVYKTAGELREKLRARIAATIY